MNKYRFVDSSTRGKCINCGKETFRTWFDQEKLARPDWIKMDYVLNICPDCTNWGEAQVFEPVGLKYRYKIASGWPNNPTWYCEVFRLKEPVNMHRHVTDSSGALKPLNTKSTDLVFVCKGSSWPIEAREGRFVKRPYDSSSDWEEFDPKLEWDSIPFLEDCI